MVWLESSANTICTGGRDVRDHVDEVTVIRGVENHAVDGAVRIGHRCLVVGPRIGIAEVAAGLHFQLCGAAFGGLEATEGEAEVAAVAAGPGSLSRAFSDGLVAPSSQAMPFLTPSPLVSASKATPPTAQVP